MQTPQVARLQLLTVPVSPIFSEITSQSVVRTSWSTVWGVPLRLKVDDIAVMACGSGGAEAAPVASTLRRNGDSSAGAATAPATMPVATLALMKFLRVNFAMRFLLWLPLWLPLRHGCRRGVTLRLPTGASLLPAVAARRSAHRAGADQVSYGARNRTELIQVVHSGRTR